MRPVVVSDMAAATPAHEGRMKTTRSYRRTTLVAVAFAGAACMSVGACGTDGDSCVGDCDGGAGEPDAGLPERTDLALCRGSEGFYYNLFDSWTAVRITPPSYPYVVERVGYRMVAAARAAEGVEAGCDSSLDDVVALSVSSDEEPPSQIEPDFMTPAPQGGSSRISQRKEVTVEPPLRVENGESIWVFVSTTTTETDIGCVSACSVPPEDADRSWVTAGMDLPLRWQSLEFLSGLSDGYEVDVIGYAELE